MIVLSRKEMLHFEKETIENFGISSEILMERAGLSIVQALWEEFGNLKNKSFTVVVGPGNNGGDGLVAARDLLNYTDAVRVVLIEEPKTSEAKKQLAIYLKHGGYLTNFSEISLSEFSDYLKTSDVVIDAIFGYGLTREITSEVYKSSIETINMYSNFVLSVDIPSGVDCDTGEILGTSVQADMTVTFGYPKPAHFLYPGRKLTGTLKVALIGIPTFLGGIKNIQKYLLTEDIISLPVRIKESHKGTYGRLFVIGGSKRYPGAPVLSSLAGLKSGVGTVILVGPQKSCEIALSLDPSLLVNQIDSQELNIEHIKKALSDCTEKDTILIGPGLDVDYYKRDILEYVLKESNPRCVIIDADGLNILSKDITLLEKRNVKNIVLTPHPGEFARLTSLSIREVKQNYSLVLEFARKYNVSLVLKDATSIISDGTKIYFNITGNSSLSKTGSGDILAGIVASFISQGLEPTEALKSAVYTFGKVGESVESEGFNTAYDLLTYLSKVSGWFKSI